MEGQSHCINIGDYVRVVADYHERTLAGQTNTVVALPDENYADEYMIRFDGGILRSVFLEGKEEWIPATSLESAIRLT